ncbi:MAG: D-tyrosyl-tRNA(Tyr) deacylase [Gammaproteobacteria bacterium]|nr:D-tyrosyl-tRNA(Tyr) deacylase [Gammaproteobacteria bacterium]
MIALLQRVTHARVRVGAETTGAIEQGILALIGVERGDTEREAERLLDRLLGYRIFADDAGRMNRSVRDMGGGLLLVPQFTLAADNRSGTRASFTTAAEPGEGRRLFDYFASRTIASHAPVALGRFGAHMQVELCNDGPVTFWLQVAPPAIKRPVRVVGQ